MDADLYAPIQNAIWEGRWLALVSIWNAMLTHPWIIIAMTLAISHKGKRAVLRLAQWIGAIWWHHVHN